MPAIRNGHSPNHNGREEGRPILSLRIDAAPLHSQLGGVEQDEHSGLLTGVQRFEQALWNARNAWSVRQARRGLFSGRRLSKSDAERALAKALAEQAKELAL